MRFVATGTDPVELCHLSNGNGGEDRVRTNSGDKFF